MADRPTMLLLSEIASLFAQWTIDVPALCGKVDDLARRDGADGHLVSTLAIEQTKALFSGILSTKIALKDTGEPAAADAVAAVRYVIEKSKLRGRETATGGALFTAAIMRVGETARTAVPFAAVTRCLDLFLSFLTDIGIKNPLGKSLAFGNGHTSPITAATHYDREDLIRYLSTKEGIDLHNLDEDPSTHGAYKFAMMKKNLSLFKTLVDCGLKGSARITFFEPGARRAEHHIPVLHYLAKQVMEERMGMTQYMGRSKEQAERQTRVEVEMLRYCLEKDPSAAKLRVWTQGSNGYQMVKRSYPFTYFCLKLNDKALLKAALEAGAPIDYNERDLHGVECVQTTSTALRESSPEVLAMLVDEFGLFKDWKTKMDGEGAGEAACALVRLAAQATVSSPIHGVFVSQEEAYRKAEIVLKAGFNLTADNRGKNLLLLHVTCPDAEMRPSYRGSESDILRVLQLFKAHGANVRDQDSARCPNFQLIHHAALKKLPKIAEWALSEAGCDVNALGRSDDYAGVVTKLTPLGQCLESGQADLGLLLVRKFNALPVLEGVPWEDQPLMAGIRASMVRDEREVLPVLRHFFDTRKDLLDPKWWKPAPDGSLMTPVTACVHFKRPRILEALLLSGQAQAHLDAALNTVEAVPTYDEDPFRRLVGTLITPSAASRGGGSGRTVYASATQLAASRGTEGNACLGLILQHCSGIVRVAALPTAPKTIPKTAKRLESVEALIKKSKDSFDRKVMVAFETALLRERERGGASAGAAGAGAGAASNAFEDPSLKVLSAKELKAKAKKKEQKKKAKAKKRAAAAAAAAGAGGAALAPDDSDSDSSSGDDEGHAGMTAEERMLASIPSFDLERELRERERKAKEEAGAEGKAAEEKAGESDEALRFI